MELDLPDFLTSPGPYWCECGCGDCRCAPSGLVIGTELGLAIEDCEGVQVEISL